MFSFFSSKPSQTGFPLTLNKKCINFFSDSTDVPLFKQVKEEIYAKSQQYDIEISPPSAILGQKLVLVFLATTTFFCVSSNYKPIELYAAYESVIMDQEEVDVCDVIKNTSDTKVSTAACKDKMVIVKQFKLTWTDEARIEFANILKDISKYKCDNLVNIVGGILSPDEESIVMEYAHFGNSIMRYRSNDLNNTLKLKMFVDVAKALYFLHSHKVIHGNVKPSNMLVFNYWDIQKITKTTRNNMNDNDMIQAAIFTAPEVLKGNCATKESDIYSFGISMLEKKPFINGWDAVLQVAKGKRPTIETSINETIQNLIEKCWNQEPDERPLVNKVLETLNSVVF
ncbi:Protein kinase [Entamoeba marina]